MRFNVIYRSHIARWLSFALLLGVQAAAKADEPRYRIMDLPPLPGSISSRAYAVDESGTVIGVSYINHNGNIANARPTIWRNGVPELLWIGPLNSCYFCDPPVPADGAFDGGIPLAMNDHGTIVGRMQQSSYTGTSGPRRGTPDGSAFTWTPDDRLQLIAMEFDGLRSEAVAVNNAGLIVGVQDDATELAHGYSLDAAGNFRELPLLPGGAWVRPTDVNDLGQIVGNGDIGEGHERAFLLNSAGAMTDLGTLENGSSSRAFAINEQGMVVGYSHRASGPIRAFVWTSDDGMIDLGAGASPPHVQAASNAVDINSRGQIIGEISNIGPVLWNLDRSLIILESAVTNMSGWQFLSDAVSINDNGLIVGTGTRAESGLPHGFVLLPVPEPSTLTLVLVPFSVIAVRAALVKRRRWRSRNSEGVDHGYAESASRYSTEHIPI